MKRNLSLFFSLLLCAGISAQNLELDVNHLDNTFGGVTTEGNVVQFSKSWTGGAGWWIGGDDWSRYNAVTLEFEKVGWQVAINVEYGTETESNGYEQAISTQGQGKVRLVLNPEKKNSVQKVYIQSSKGDDVTLIRCTVEGGADPYDISSMKETALKTEEGENCQKVFKQELLSHSESDVVVVTLNCLDEAKQLGWGIAKIVAMDDWNVSQYDFPNKCNGLGISEYRFLISELIDFAKKGGSEWHYGEDSKGYGCIVNIWPGISEIVSIKCYTKATAVEDVAAEHTGAKKVIENGRLYIIRNGVRYDALTNVVE